MAITQRIYFGDYRLWREPIEPPLEKDCARTVTQEFQGLDRDRALLVSASSSTAQNLVARCLGFPSTTATTMRAWLSLKRAIRRSLVERSQRKDPLVYIEDDTLSKTVASYLAPNATVNGHGRSVGDRLLIRRAGTGLWSLVRVTVVADPNTIAIAAETGTTIHALENGDEVHLVEAYWLGAVWLSMTPQNEMGWYAKELTYVFRYAGILDYARTAAPSEV